MVFRLQLLDKLLQFFFSFFTIATIFQNFSEYFRELPLGVIAALLASLMLLAALLLTFLMSMLLLSILL
jgi:hypothetical protein